MWKTTFEKLWETYLLVSLFNQCAQSSQSTPTVSFAVDKDDVDFKASPWFLSLGMDSNLIRNRWETFDFGSERLATLATGLSPAFLRLSGTDGDRMIFQTGDDIIASPRDEKKREGLPFPPTNFTMTRDDWDHINVFAAKVGWRIVFGFNAQLRKPWHDRSIWETENALSLLKYSIDRGYADNLDFQLGNEPDIYNIILSMEVISGKQLARDYNMLASLLRVDLEPHYKSSKLYGPSIANVLPFNKTILKEFLDGVDPGVLEGVTWHQYYGGSDFKYLANYTDPKLLDTYAGKCQDIVDVVRSTRDPDIRIWQGETSSAYAPPGSNICESYVAGFMLLDKLGLSAQYGMEVVIMQTFYGFWFALVDRQIEPTPNYWVALLYRQLVGTHVLSASSETSCTGNDGNSRSVRYYTHCVAHDNKEYYTPGAVVLYVMNLQENDVFLNFEATGGEVVEFLFTPLNGDLQSQTVLLNGEKVHMPDDSNLPKLQGRKLLDPTKVSLPSKRFAFYVIEDAKAGACGKCLPSNSPDGSDSFCDST